MMSPEKWLHIVRHGKSTWEYPNIRDIDRPLNERGISGAHTMAERFKTRYPLPDILLSSPAARAAQTALIFTRMLGASFNKLKFKENIYEADAEDIVQIIKTTNDNLNSLVIFGHNPTFTEAANLFYPHFIGNIPTCGMVSLKFNTNTWEKISKATLINSAFDYPKSV